ncbi:TIGR03943 family putative permease subunit [Clostridium felsineum]|uniref:Two-component membrane permease complex subunit SMU_746c n=1 Tax=Clostridium felsineum TaxID=36839 RepID=A0A1S8LBC7_9CLOT|nr:TIGR03943 family protein [Clostridium felsineum]MCR3760622.1 TIGR03943 family protein [Clostridium felsineum]URZ00457.1 Putative two-component membrane permease complex subunit SMU_746c [Clostridium felsineum]URZ06904.1 Putative two-component membrane permease complex subunit SMU_746c [Clostridium felsineum]URZ11936.1 Putative two-component membrane permease complex subunit SMU_746c [Clostridium felsineum]URZ16471.1 Putative two-component membrane permease complex subunit SMU_746c [Clostrid
MKSEFKWFIILLGFTYYMYYLISSKKLYLFIHPKMTAYIIFAFIVFFILSIFQIKKLFFDKSSNSIKIASSIFFLPLILAYLINPQGLNSNIAEKKGLTTTSLETTNPVLKTQANSIKLNDENFSDMTSEIENNINKYKGKDIEISGFIFKDSSFPKNHFVIARMLIVCCAADAEVVGLTCNTTFNKLKANDWVTIKGTINSMNNFDKENTSQPIIPVINVKSVHSIQKPSNPYIYLKKSLSK